MQDQLTGNVLDRALAYFAPTLGLRRMRARAAAAILARHYEGASVGRRTQGWRNSSGDANKVMAGNALARLREAARDLVRNNGYAESACYTIGDDVVGWGIIGKPSKRNKTAAELWQRWAESTDCDSDGRNDFYGLQKLVMRTVVESGEVLVRRRLRFPEDGLSIPVQLQVLDPDYIDTSKHGVTTQGGGKIVHGIEYNVLGQRTAYWLFRDHPGSDIPPTSFASYAVPAESILHVFKQSRPGQVRGPSWFAPVLLKFKDFDEFEDATLMKQKIAACLAVITTDVDGNSPALGATSSGSDIDSLEPGMILNVPPGRSVQTVQPPTVREYADYSATTLRAIATGLGVTYEQLTGNYAGMPFSAARMSRLRHWARVEDWRWRTLIPQFCAPAWAWAFQVATMAGLYKGDAPLAKWTAPPAAMIDPQNEGLAYQRNIRTGLMTLSEALRERGFDPVEALEEMAADNALLDKLMLVLDSDPRKTTQQGLSQQAIGGGEPADDEPPKPPADDDEGDDEAAAAAEGREARLLRALSESRRPITVHSSPVTVHGGDVRVEAPTTIARDAVRVEAPTTIEAGAIRAETTIERGAVQVEAPTTIAKDAIRVDAPTTIAAGAIRAETKIEKGAVQVDAPVTVNEGETRVEVPLTVADTVHTAAGRTTFQRGEDGRLTGFVTEGVVPQVLAVRSEDDDDKGEKG